MCLYLVAIQPHLTLVLLPMCLCPNTYRAQDAKGRDVSFLAELVLDSQDYTMGTTFKCDGTSRKPSIITYYMYTFFIIY